MFCARCGTEVNKSGKFCPSCGLDLGSMTVGGSAPLTADPPPAQTEFDIVKNVLKDEYELIKELGRGGMATVYRAREKGLDREVAVKVLPFSLAFDKDFVERFQREARTAAKLEHPNIIPIYRVGRHDNVIYFVMKFLRGKSLSDVIKQNGALPPVHIRKLLAETAYALHYAHKNGIVHRDIKPDNIMLDEMDRAIVTDFGIAKAASGTKLTGTGMSIGTPHYMSPEQARAQGLDGRSDVYSLGVVAYQCLTGHVPFDGEDSFSIGYKHVTEDIPTPELHDAEQRELFEIVRRMMAKNPADRFQDAEHLARVLEGKAAVPATPISSAPTVSMRAATTTTLSGAQRLSSSSTPTTPMPRTDVRPPMPKPAKRSGGGVLVGMFFMLLLVAGGGGGWFYYTNPQQVRTLLGLEGKSRPDSAKILASADSAAHDSSARADSVRKDSVHKDSVAKPVVTKPLPTTGTLLVTGLPAGGRVRVDGTAYDATGPITLEPGSHKIEALATGYDDFSTTFAVARGVQVPLSISMTKTVGRARAGEKPAPLRTGGTEPAKEPGAAATPATCPDSPAEAVANANNVCYDDRPVPLGSPLVPVADDIVATRPSPSILLVRVGPDGTVQQVFGKQISSNTTFHSAALAYARTLTFKPAQKDGQPVKAWVEVMLRPTKKQ